MRGPQSTIRRVAQACNSRCINIVHVTAPRLPRLEQTLQRITQTETWMFQCDVGSKPVCDEAKIVKHAQSARRKNEGCCQRVAKAGEVIFL